MRLAPTGAGTSSPIAVDGGFMPVRPGVQTLGVPSFGNVSRALAIRVVAGSRATRSIRESGSQRPGWGARSAADESDDPAGDGRPRRRLAGARSRRAVDRAE